MLAFVRNSSQELPNIYKMEWCFDYFIIKAIHFSHYNIINRLIIISSSISSISSIIIMCYMCFTVNLIKLRFKKMIARWIENNMCVCVCVCPCVKTVLSFYYSDEINIRKSIFLSPMPRLTSLVETFCECMNVYC